MAKKKAKAEEMAEPAASPAAMATGPTLEACPVCQSPLIEIPWGEPAQGQRSFILACNNHGCPRYRNPVKTIVKEAVK